MRRLLGWIFVGGIGAVIGYLFDPDRGRHRRAQLRDQLTARTRDVAQEAERSARYQAGRAKGAVAGLIPDQPPEDDASLLQKVRSEAIGPSAIPTDDIEIHVDDGVVVIRGRIPDPQAADELVSRIRNVTGVRDVYAEISTSHDG